MPSVMAEARFRACLAQTLKWEGTWSNDPHDPGGPTMRGIIQREYDAYRTRKSLPRRSVRQIEQAELEEIYRTRYWDEVNGDLLPAGVDLAVWDFGVNSGPSRGIKALQRALGTKADGHMGELTMKALEQRDPDEIIAAIMADRRAFLRQIKTFWRFGKGWLRRCDGVEKAALEMAGAHHAVSLLTAAAAEPDGDPEVQSAGMGKAKLEPPATTASTAEGKAAATTTIAGGAGTGLAVAQAAGAAYVTGQGFDAALFLITLAQSEIFWLSATAVISGVIGWVSRGHTLVREAA